MKQYDCVQANHHNGVGPIIEEYVQNGWTLLKYEPVTLFTGSKAGVNHYLLFERKKPSEEITQDIIQDRKDNTPEDSKIPNWRSQYKY
jgi:hypothetical protein